jgi:hypothetical protein
LIEDVETKLSFSVKNISSKKIYLLISDYKIPVFILNDITPDDKPSGIQELTFIPSTLSDNVIPGKNYLFKVTLQNTVSNLSIENIEIKDDLDLNITPRKISRINGLDYVILEISVAVNKDLKQNISGKISASYNNKEIILPLDFMLTKNKSEELLSNNSITNDLSCSSIGVLCKENEVCSGKTTKSLQGPCCIGSCIMQKQANVSKYIGLAIILGILAVLVYFYLRSKKIKPKSPQQILKEKSEEYRQKINPNSKEVSRSLEKV